MSSLLTTPEIILKLVFLSVISLAPILGRGKLRSMISHKPRVLSADDERKSRWTWVQEWRTKIRMGSRSRAREQDQLSLDTLVEEKRRLEDLSYSWSPSPPSLYSYSYLSLKLLWLETSSSGNPALPYIARTNSVTHLHQCTSITYSASTLSTRTSCDTPSFTFYDLEPTNIWYSFTLHQFYLAIPSSRT